VYLVDTNVLSAAAPTRAGASPALTDWMERNSAGLYISVVTVAEVEDGISKARREGASRKADRLFDWLETVLHLYSARVLPIDLLVARLIGRLSDVARGMGQAPGLADLAIAATALQHGCVILTRNLRHFGFFDVACHDPFESLPPKPGYPR
jgi:predicted nucleic acid-binding protein